MAAEKVYNSRPNNTLQVMSHGEINHTICILLAAAKGQTAEPQPNRALIHH